MEASQMDEGRVVMVTEEVEKHLQVWQMHRPIVFRCIPDEDWFRMYDILWHTSGIIEAIEDGMIDLG